MKRILFILLLALVGFTTQAQCTRCKHPKVYIENGTVISYPCIHWYRAVKRSMRRTYRHKHPRKVLFITI